MVHNEYIGSTRAGDENFHTSASEASSSNKLATEKKGKVKK